ncbi:hypothetical protein AAF712_010175 [Marasmius tenuissimus]|uniref:Uncharacterized protein n=1 Tax=Marasmius tenuissimus TaxID=585030 RepID=A0ABR2ZPL7_9AGAR
MANNRRTSKEHVKSYETYLFKYYSQSSSLYRALQNKPIQHMAGHFGECLASMGPAHAYQTSAFERVNGLLQDINTNGKIGEMEATFLNHYSEAAMLAGILASDTATRDSAEEVIRQHERHNAKKSLSSAMMHEDLSVGDGVRGRRILLGSEALANVAELFGLEEHSLEAEWSLFPTVVLDSVEYVASGGNRTTVPGSYVMLHHHSPSDSSTTLFSSSQVRAALIIHIFRDRNHNLRVTYRLFNTSISLEQDVYRELDMGHLTSRALEEPLYVTEVKNIVCPCVATEMDILGQCVMHILPYDRKCPPFGMVSHSKIRQADQLEAVSGELDSGELDSEHEHRPKRKRYV